MTIHWKAVELYFTVMLFVFQSHPVCNFEKNINFGLGTVWNEKVNLYSIEQSHCSSTTVHRNKNINVTTYCSDKYDHCGKYSQDKTQKI